MQAELPLMYAQLVSLTTYGPGAEEVFYFFPVLPGAKLSTEVSYSPKQMNPVIKSGENKNFI